MAEMVGGQKGPERGTDLRAYVPRVQLEWLSGHAPRRAAVLAGTLVFADISGFTPLTERLARQGRVGAERLTDVLNDVFGRLLGAAFAHGGDMLKFGGDALLLLFTEEAHELRAAAAAAAMQEELRPFRRLRTDAGIVTLRMSVGAASGDVHGALVGDSHRELLVLGPVVSHMAELEAAADPGEVLLSTATAAHLPDRARGEPKDGGVLLASKPDAPPAGVGSAPPDAADCDLCVPASIRSHLRGAGGDGEHRLVVIAFVQFKGSDDLLRAEGPTAVADELHRLVVQAQEACAEYGVAFLATDVDRNGGKLLLAAGAPVATPDDEDRMLLAVRHVLGAPSRLAVRAGVNRGHAFAVDMGSPARRTYAVMGDVTNLAARVMGKAGPGQLLATAAVLDHVRTEFALEPVPHFTVKGKSAPVSAAVVGPPLGRHQRDVRAPLHGRTQELDELRRAVEAARNGSGRALELRGEPGIGKTRLLSEAARVGGITDIVEITGGVYASNTPYSALRPPLRRLVGVAPTDGDDAVRSALQRVLADRAPQLGPWISLLGPLVGLGLPTSPEVDALDPRFRALRTHAVATELLDALLPGPAIFLVDDAQWLDDATGSLLGFVLNDIAARPWLIAIAERDSDSGPKVAGHRAGTVLPLAGLDDVEAAALVDALASLADRSLAPHDRAAIVARSSGNPLFLEELTRSALDGRDMDALPDTVEGMLASRIDVLPPGDRTILRRASVLGSRFPRRHLAAMAEVPDVDAVVERLHDFLVPGRADEVEWRQPIVRDIAYESLPYQRRRQLHATAARLVEESAAGDLLAWAELLSVHHAAAHDHAPAWHHARIAGLRARGNAAPIDAAAFFTRALDAARHLDLDDDEVAEVNELLGEVAELGGRYDVAAAAYGRARRLRTDPVQLAGLCAREGHLRERSGRAQEALGWFTRGSRLLDAAERPESELEPCRTELQLGYAGTRLRQGRAAASIPHLEDAARRAEAAGDRRLLARAYYLMDWAHSELGHQEASRYRGLALPIYEELGDHAGLANVLNNLGVDAYFEGRWDEALELYERSRAARQRAGDLVEMGTAANNVGEILSDQGHLDRAQDLFREAMGIWRPAGFHVGVGLVTSNLGRVASRSGRFDEAADLLAEAAARLTVVGAESLGLEALGRDVERRVLADVGGALELADEVVDRATRLGGQGVLLAMVDRWAGCALAQAGRRDAAVERLRTALARARRVGAPYEVALTQQVLARLDPHDAAAAREAAAILARLGVISTPTVPLPVVV